MSQKIQDIADMDKVTELMTIWARATGLRAAVFSSTNKYVTGVISSEGDEGGAKPGNDFESVPFANADFDLDIELTKTKVGHVMGGRCKDMKNASQSDEEVAAAGELLKDVLESYMNGTYMEKRTNLIFEHISKGVDETHELVKEIRKSTASLRDLQSRQKILALNANIEAARAGEYGKGFGVVADEVGRLSESSSAVNGKITELIRKIGEVVNNLLSTQNLDPADHAMTTNAEADKKEEEAPVAEEEKPAE